MYSSNGSRGAKATKSGSINSKKYERMVQRVNHSGGGGGGSGVGVAIVTALQNRGRISSIGSVTDSNGASSRYGARCPGNNLGVYFKNG